MNTNLSSLSALVGRALIAWLFVPAGFAKLTGLAGAMAYTASGGLPGWLAIPALAVELLGGLAILVGWQTRVVAFLLAGFCLLSGVIFHGDLGDQAQRIQLLKNLGLAGGLLFLVAHGAGAWSLDNRRSA